MRSTVLVPSLALAAILLVPACRRDERASTSSPPANVSASPSSAPGPPKSLDAASLGASGSPAGATVDLLHFAGAAVAVSSNVDNPRDFPEHLVDGRSDTAWNGKSGDLRAAWIAFRVPDKAHVDRIEMSVGFDKKSAEGDLFTMNHRIKRVRVKRGTTVLREHAFDVDIRTPQSIPVDAEGGSFRIEVLETLPGSKTEWKEICVSELRVLGTPSKETRAREIIPSVGIGAFPGESQTAVETGARERTEGEKAVAGLLGRAFPTGADFCRAYDAVMNPILERLVKEGWEMIPDPHSCKIVGPLAPSFAPVGDITAVFRVRIFLDNWSEDRVGVETPEGFFVPSGPPIESPAYNDPGCFGHTTTHVQTVRALGASVDIVVSKTWQNRRYAYTEDGGVAPLMSSDDVSRENLVCSLSGKAMTCKSTVLDRICHLGPDVVSCGSL